MQSEDSSIAQRLSRIKNPYFSERGKPRLFSMRPRSQVALHF